jgi:hypothetical protein
MNDAKRYESVQDPLDDEERELVDPENCDWESPVEVVVADDPLVSFRIALNREEHKRLAHAARAKGLTTPDFIKFAALEAPRAEAPQT